MSCRCPHFKVSESFAIKLMARWQTQGDIAPRPRARPSGSGKLAPYRDFLRAQVESQPDVTLAELTEALKKKHDVDVHLSNVARCLNKMGLSYKKTLVATERDRPDVQRKRRAWHKCQNLMRMEPSHLVFIDETSTNTKMTRLYGRAPKGERLISDAPFGHWHTDLYRWVTGR